MSVLDSFIAKKNAESVFLSLADGESVRILKLKDIKAFTKPGFNGELKECLRLIVDVETVEGLKTKNFDNATARFANELRDKGVQIGSSFTLSRAGEQTNTRYSISEVTLANGAAVPAPAAPAASAPATEHAAE